MNEKIDGFKIYNNEKSQRIINIHIEDQILEKLLFSFNKFDLTALELKPFSRFTIAKSLDELSKLQLSKIMNSIIKDRKTGCFIISPETMNSKLDDTFVKLSTGAAHLMANQIMIQWQINIMQIP